MIDWSCIVHSLTFLLNIVIRAKGSEICNIQLGSTIYECVEKYSMTIVCDIWMICSELNWFVYDPSWMLHLSEFVWILRSSVLVVFNNFLLIDATDRSKISSDQKRFFIALSLYSLSFFANTPFNDLERSFKSWI